MPGLELTELIRNSSPRHLTVFARYAYNKFSLNLAIFAHSILKAASKLLKFIPCWKQCYRPRELLSVLTVLSSFKSCKALVTRLSYQSKCFPFKERTFIGHELWQMWKEKIRKLNSRNPQLDIMEKQRMTVEREISFEQNTLSFNNVDWCRKFNHLN